MRGRRLRECVSTDLVACNGLPWWKADFFYAVFPKWNCKTLHITRKRACWKEPQKRPVNPPAEIL